MFKVLVGKRRKNGELSGTSGKKLRLEAIKINLSGDVSRYYDVYYRVHIQDKGWLNWALMVHHLGVNLHLNDWKLFKSK